MAIAGRRPRRERRVGRPTGGFGYNYNDPWLYVNPSTPVLDSFNSGPTQALSTRPGWGSGHWGVGDFDYQTDSVPTVANCALGTQASNVWGSLLTADQEAWFTFGAQVDSTQIIIRGNSASSTSLSAGYIARISWNGPVTIESIGHSVLISGVAASPAVGDSYCFQAIGTIFSVYRKPSGGAWGMMIQTADSVTNAAGYIGMLNPSGSPVSIDEFGGGNVPYVAPTFVETQNIHVIRRVWAGR